MVTPRCVLSVLVTAILLSAVITDIAASRTWNVNPAGTGDAPTIQAAIDSASNGDVVLLADGTYTGDGNRDIDVGGKVITIISQNGRDACTINIGSSSPLDPHFGFQFSSGETSATELSGITITGGYYFSGGGVVIDNASPTIAGCRFSENEAMVGGGAIGIEFGSPLVTWCSFENNAAPAGGAVYCNNASPTFQYCVFESDSASTNGGAFLSEHGSPTVNNCRFLNNRAGASGGAIRCFYDDNVTLTDLFLSGNGAEQAGGGISLEDIVVGTVSGCTLTVNTAMGGGAVHIAGNATFSHCTMYQNTATQSGGAIIYAGGTVEITNCTLDTNSAPFGGGMTCSDDQPVTVTNSIISYSTQGEAVFGTVGAEVGMDCCDIFGNAGGDWTGVIAGQDALAGNFSADPEYCGEPQTGNFDLQSDSPCAPGNHPKKTACGQIGARPVGCATTPVRKVTWGEIKALLEQQ
jgi:predicted outer membrane repeat protein